MRLRDDEKAMLDGHEGKAKQRAMELLVRYAQALGCEEFVDTTNVAGVPGQSSVFLDNYYQDRFDAPFSHYDVLYSLFDLDSDDIFEVPRVATRSCHLQGGTDPVKWQVLGATADAARIGRASEAGAVDKGIEILKTCTPYLVGNVPAFGEHCAWMESSAVIYCNSVLGARTNTEGRESTSAAMLTGKIPNFGFHLDEHRRGTHQVNVTIPVDSLMDWGMLGYYVGEKVLEYIPVISGIRTPPDTNGYKHFGAAAASSGGVELYHIVGVTPEAPTLDTAFGGNSPAETYVYDAAARRATYENLNSNGSSTDVDYVMLGCPHAALDQIEEACRLLDGRRISEHCRLWIFTSRAVRQQADDKGLSDVIRKAGGHILTDTCSAIGQAVPPGTRVVALDSAKQVHYLPAIMGIEAWFGTTADCINAALTGRWEGQLE